MSKVIIAGPRDYKGTIKIVDEAVEASGFNITRVVSGKAKGIDTLAIEWAIYNDIPWKEFPAEWNNFDLPKEFIFRKKRRDGSEYNALAGIYRNRKMAEYVAPKGKLIAIWNKHSAGTRNMIETADLFDLEYYIHYY